MHKIISIEIVQYLWIVYRKSGIEELQSKLPIHLSDTQLWPKEVHLFMKQFQIDHNHEENTCLTFIHQCLQEFNTTSEYYRRELNVKTSRLSGYSRSIDYIIEKFVQQGLQSLRIEINEQIAIVQYHYTNKIFQQVYRTQNPNENQIHLMKHLCKLKYNHETTTHEVNFLKEKISSHLVLHSFERTSIGKSPLIDRICEGNSSMMHSQSKNNLSNRRSVNIPRPLWEPQPLTSRITMTRLRLPQISLVKKKKKRRTKRCHGNRKLRRFKKKWRRRGMNEEEIKKLIDDYNRKKNEIQIKEISDNNNDQPEKTVKTTTENLQARKKKSNKRKRMVNSISSRSITEQLPKKIKKKNMNINLTTIKSNYRLPKYFCLLKK
ncbi:unnamed protein product [Rotaria sp. Silwood2]|nr:unnamed protein product [Rotaria sp. Silwood2]CAF3078992.1 unnamed protein product [Rotaria sp. Silwood2]CAF3324072.1 unnamed protein product [Rotaria sp. Silwood2]CAF3382141.1 unnamed protein product [Rotaria sp. Silwood2]CAF4344156.1 unnamed protein product [Rotaria sp. Silwood2]